MLMQQCLQLQVLFELSQASLTKASTRQEKSKSLNKSLISLKNVDLLMDKLQTLKHKVKKLDPNQESLSDIQMKLS